MPKYETKNCKKHGFVKWVLEGRGYFRCTRCRSEAVQKRRERVKEILVQEAGGKCTRCGYDRCIRALEFHHTDPSTKSFGIAQEGVTRSIARAREEASKCILVCSNCHREIEDEIFQSGGLVIATHC